LAQVHLVFARIGGNLTSTSAMAGAFPVMSKTIALAFSLTVLVAVSVAQAQEPSPIIYNLAGYEVGVIRDIKPNGDALVLPTKATVDLGYYNVIMPAGTLRPRARGGWETTMNIHDIAFLPPVPYRFFMPSGL
jgi:hypothetical protein